MGTMHVVEISAVILLESWGIVYHDPRRSTSTEIIIAYAFWVVRLREPGGFYVLSNGVHLPSVTVAGLLEHCGMGTPYICWSYRMLIKIFLAVLYL